MFDFFKKKTNKTKTKTITLQLNDKCSPIVRGQLYREPLDNFLESKEIGEVDGGGTQLQESGERAYSELEIVIEDESKFVIEELTEEIEKIGVPKGSFLILNEQNELHVGTLEGVGVYFRYTEAPEKLFDEIDMDKFWDGIDEAVEPFGKYHDYWEGEEKAAFYYYGINASEILQAVQKKMVGHEFENYIDPIILSFSIE